MQAIDAIFYIAILIMSVVVHEVSHGFMAERYGDPTARHAGRLTLNPIKHLDMFGSILLPTLLVLSKAGFVFGWAKPVPYNPDNLSDRKWGEIAVASAGVLANFLIAIIFGLIIRFSLGSVDSTPFFFITSTIVIVNLALGIFNLVPIPPLDGSKILFALLPLSMRNIVDVIEEYSLVILIFFVVFLSNILYPVLTFLFRVLTGLSL